MSTTLINFRLDTQLKKNMEALCEELGMNMTTAFTIFAKKMVKEHGIPFWVNTEPFYSKTNMDYINSVIEDVESGKSELKEHELIEE